MSFPASVSVSSNNIDWSLGNVFKKSISTNITFTFSNQSDGRTIVFKLTNTTGSALTLAWPASVTNADTTLPANSSKLFSLIMVDTNIHMTSVSV